MTFSYDEPDDFAETDDFDGTEDLEETGNFDDESQEEFLPEDDDSDADTALSQAFRQAAAAGTITDEDEVDEDPDDDTEEGDTPEAETKEDTDAEAAYGDQPIIEPVEAPPDENEKETDAAAYDDQLIEPVEAPPDENEDDLDPDQPLLELKPMAPEVEAFRPEEQDNYAYADAVTAYYEQNDYQQAIEKFNEAIAYEARSAEDSLTDANEIIAKSKYWQAEAYVKLQDLPQAIGTFEDLVETCQGHYLSLAAQRRADQLNAKNV